VRADGLHRARPRERDRRAAVGALTGRRCHRRARGGTSADESKRVMKDVE
jgi:hypothetical protein